MNILRLDHIVLTVRDIPATVSFYTTALGMREVNFGGGRTALQFGRQKINLHQKGMEFEPKAKRPTSGSADLCFIARTSLTNVIEHLGRLGVPIIEGPVSRTGAIGPITLVYIRDPDGNLIEISNYT